MARATWLLEPLPSPSVLRFFPPSCLSWFCPTTRNASGDRTSSMQQAMEKEEAMWSSIWREEQQAVQLVWPSMQAFPELTVEQLQCAAATFSTGTSTPDGWHPRAFQQFTRAALKALAQLFHVFEVVGCVGPDWVNLIRLIRKAGVDAGNRPITIFAALVRLYNKARIREIQKWLAQAPSLRSSQVMAPTRCTTDSVWSAHIQAGAQNGRGLKTEKLNWDLSKAYDPISFALLQDFWLQASKPNGHPQGHDTCLCCPKASPHAAWAAQQTLEAKQGNFAWVLHSQL